MKCENCNNIVGLGYNNCPYCGTPINNFVGGNVNGVQPNTVNNSNPTVQSNMVNNSNPTVQSNMVNNPNPTVQPNTVNNPNPTVQSNMVNNPNSTVQPNMVNNPNPTVQPNTVNDHKGKKVKGLIAALIFIIAIVGIAGGLLVYFTLPRQIFTTSLDKIVKPVLKGLEYESYLTDFEFNSEIQSENAGSEFNEIANIFNNISISGKMGVDVNNKLALMELDSNFNDKELISANMYLQDAKAYIYLEELFDKYISADVEDYEEIFNVTDANEDLKEIINDVTKAFKKSLKNEYFTKEKENGFTKNTLVLDHKNTSEIVINVLELLKKNEKFISSITEIANIERQDVLDGIEEALDQLKSITEYKDDNIIKISIYTKGLFGTLSKFSIDSEELSIYVNKDSKYDYSYKIVQYNEELLSGKVYYNNTNKKNTLNFTIDLDGIILKFNLNYNTKYNGDLEKVNVKDSIDYTEFTEDDATVILENLEKNEGLVELVEKLENLDLGDINLGDSSISKGETHKLTDVYGDTGVIVNVPSGAKIDFQGNFILTYSINNVDVSAEISFNDSVDDYFKDFEEYDMKSLQNASYTNVKLSELKSVQTASGLLYYKELSYNSNYTTDTYYEKIYCLQVSDEMVYSVSLESKNQANINSILEDALKFEIER